MLDQAKTEESSEAPVSEFFENVEVEWAAVLAAAPAMARLPEMVAQQYLSDAYPDPKEHQELQTAVHDRVRTGLIFVFKIIKNNVNKLFENFDVRFGSAVDLLMDDLEVMVTDDPETVENYTGEQVCGRLFAYIAMEAYCQHRCKEDPNDGTGVDDQTGFFKDMDSMAVLLILESVLSCVKMTPDFKVDTRREATLAVHTHIFLLLETNVRTVWH